MKTADEAYYEALDGININKNEKIILKSKNHHYSYLFARDLPRANIKAHEKVILESKNLEYCYNFARCIPGANKEELFKVILESKNKFWINNFLEYVNFDKEKYINYILFI